MDDPPCPRRPPIPWPSTAPLTAPTGPLRLIATHLGLRPYERRLQMRRLLAQPNDAVTVLLGDLNEWFLWGRPLRWLRSRYGATPAPATYPSAWPVLALDGIWVSPHRMLRELKVHASPLARVASDHLPLRAEISLPVNEQLIVALYSK